MNLNRLTEEVLAEYPEARNNDNVLQAIVWQRQGLGLTRKQLMAIKNLSSGESITRERRKLQREGKYQPNPEIKVFREARRVKFTKRLGVDNRPMYDLYKDEDVD